MLLHIRITGDDYLVRTMTSSYADCVACLRTSLSFLESSVETLENGVSDFPRLGSVLKTVRVNLSLAPMSGNRETDTWFYIAL